MVRIVLPAWSSTSICHWRWLLPMYIGKVWAAPLFRHMRAIGLGPVAYQGSGLQPVGRRLGLHEGTQIRVHALQLL